MESKRAPLYRQVEQYLCRLISSNVKKGISLIPSENSLAKQFNVSRITIRHAVENLVKKGLLLRKKGAGTYIVPDFDTSVLNEFKKYDTTIPIAEIYKERRTVAVIVPDLKSRYMLELLNGIQEAASAQGWNIFLSVSQYSQPIEAELIKKSIVYSNALIIFPVNKEVYNREIIKLSMQKFPLIVIDNLLNGIETSSITSDNKKAADKAVKYFLSKGKRKIGIVSQAFNSAFTLKQRYYGYERALQEARIPIDKTLILDDLEHYDDENVTIIKKFIVSHPMLDALLVFNYELGIKTLKAIKQLKNIGITTDDIIIFDEEFSEIRDFLQFDIKYVKQNARLIGNTAFQIILDSITFPNYLTQHRLIDCTLHT